MLKRLAMTRPNSRYLDLYTNLLNEVGGLRTELYLDDQLHLNEQGYQIWAEAILQHETFVFKTSA